MRVIHKQLISRQLINRQSQHSSLKRNMVKEVFATYRKSPSPDFIKRSNHLSRNNLFCFLFSSVSSSLPLSIKKKQHNLKHACQVHTNQSLVTVVKICYRTFRESIVFGGIFKAYCFSLFFCVCMYLRVPG